MCTRQKLLRHRRAQYTGGRRYFPRFYRGNLSRVGVEAHCTRTKRDKEKEDTLPFRSVITSSCTNVGTSACYIEENAKRHRAGAGVIILYIIHALVAIYFSATLCIAHRPRYLRASFAPSTLLVGHRQPRRYSCLRPRSRAASSALHRKMRAARRPFTVNARAVAAALSAVIPARRYTSVTLTRCSPFANAVYPYGRIENLKMRRK